MPLFASKKIKTRTSNLCATRRITTHSTRLRHCRHVVRLRKRRAEHGVSTPLNGLRVSGALYGPKIGDRKLEIGKKRSEMNISIWAFRPW